MAVKHVDGHLVRCSSFILASRSALGLSCVLSSAESVHRRPFSGCLLVEVPGIYLIANVDDPLVIVEVKTPNEISDAQQESFDYLTDLDSRVAAGISTDGFTWNLHWAVGTNGTKIVGPKPMVSEP